MKRAWRSWAWLLPLLLYLALTLHQLSLPGPNYDEAVEAKPAVQLLQHLPVEAHRNAVIHLGSWTLPLMIVDYVGALNAWVLILFFKIGGISVPVMRAWPILVGAVIILLTWQVGREFFGQGVGFAAALLLAVQPSFVFFARQGIYVTNTTIALMLAIWLALARWGQTGQPRWLWLTAWMAGLGLWAKFIMLWPLAATLILIPGVWYGRNALGYSLAAGFSPAALRHPRQWGPALVAFLVGLFPFILFNVKTGATFQHFLKTLNRSYYGVENTAYTANLLTRWGQMRDFVRGDHFWYLGGSFADPWAWPAFLLALALIPMVLVWRRRDPRRRALALRVALLALFFLLLLLQTPLTPTALWYTHLAMFSPVVALLIAGGWGLLLHGGKGWAGWLLAALGLGLLTFGGLGADVQYHRALAASGGYADHSDAIYRLGDELLARGIFSPYALDWGFDAPLILVTQGRVNPIEIFGYEPYDHPDADFPQRVQPLLQRADTYFLVHAADRTNFPGRREAIQAQARQMGIPLETVAVIRERSGAVHTEVWHPVP